MITSTEKTNGKNKMITLALEPKAKAVFEAKDIQSGMHFAKNTNEKKTCAWSHVELNRELHRNRNK